MNEEELSDIIKKISGMIGSNNSENCDNSTCNSSNFNSSDSTSDDNFSNSSTPNGSNNSDNNFNIDFETLLKIKTMMDKMNSHQDNSRSNLLLSLKPYLKDSRKDKVDQYIKLLNMGDMLELFMNNNNDGGGNK